MKKYFLHNGSQQAGPFDIDDILNSSDHTMNRISFGCYD
jgi:hypothetical protein